MENRGSVWIKIDLHVHTPSSMCSDYGGDTEKIWDRFIDELENLPKEIKVLGINDYLFLDGYRKVLEHKNNGRLNNFDLILPLIEFRLKEFVGNSNLARLNYHIIFANEKILSASVIETHFLSGLRGKANLSCDKPDKVSWGGVVTKESLIQLGKSIYNSTPVDKRNNQKNYLEIGFNNINFEISKIENLLGEGDEPNSFLKGNYFKAIGKAEWEDFRWNQSPGEKKTIINNSHFVFTASPTPEIAQSGENSLIAQKVNSRLLHSSDAHGFSDDINNTKPKEIGHCFSWIKAEPTFEGLRQILFEPILRRKIQSDTPDIKLPHKCIKSVSFKGHDDFIENKIFFNNDLNAIIGGKSSGKSLLLYYIANSIDYKYAFKQLNPDPSKKEVEDKIEDKYGFSEQQSFDFEVTWNDNVTYKFSERETIKDRKFVYIPQSYILNLTDKIRTKSRKTLGKIIRDILLQDEKSNELYKEFLVAVKKLDNSRDSQIDLYFKNEDAVETLEKEKKSIGDKEGIKNYIESQDLVLQTLKKNANITDNELSRYDSLNNRLEKINTYHSDLKLELNKIKESIEQQKSSFSHEYSAEDFQYNSAKEFIEKYNQIVLESDKKLDNLNNEIEKKESSIKTRVDSIKLTIEQELKPITSKLKEKTKIKAIEDTIKKEKTKLNRIEKIEESINGHHTHERLKIKAKIIELYKEAYDEYDKIIDVLNKRGKDFEDINLIGTVKFYHKRYRENLLPFFNRNSTKTREVLDTNLCKDHGNSLPDVIYNSHIQEIETVFDKIVNDELPFTKHREKKDCIKALFKDEFFDYWELKIKNDEMANMSPGKANLVILKLLVELSESDAPILIDQPEDNLDNRSIYHDLVQFLRKRKADRQIIIVSHNPNIVVSADSENVIVANQKDQDEGRDNKEYRFEYINGALENSFKLSDDKKEDIGILKSMGIREHVTDILEGGEEAFLKREEKYGF